ncbi:peptide chain release factor N(5)-glutamine methyltransferase [Limnoglobus roseus]|uniref:Release factor glutamine methyltransferase n=1 Tax=Limnoglobus roseus TaxID=2598579 RepID=A0A5C1A8K7_9BACT|nr:peptide chain release factor N(5)-glutamine methyltransferase [Limnoglobus roseus]QEL14346.1 peptide chain release factor N(5)-glutamine methyltransferase [Limnoglobus roseus]
MAETAWTIKALLQWTTEHFTKKGLDSPRLDAELLLAHVLNCKRIDLIVRYDELPTDAEKTAFRELVKKRLDRCPTAYLVGVREFYLLPFEVTPAVLIPRPDTETLVDAAIDFLKKRPTPTALDVGTGSGCVAVSLANAVKAATVTAADVSPDALAVAKRNAKRNGVADRVQFLNGNLFSPLSAGTSFDLIVSNPPYIPPVEIETLMPEVKDHEPRIALDGGTDGLAFYRRLSAESGRWLKPGGGLMVEIGHTQADAVRNLFESAGFQVGKTIKDRGGRPRVVVGKMEKA